MTIVLIPFSNLVSFLVKSAGLRFPLLHSLYVIDLGDVGDVDLEEDLEELLWDCVARERPLNTLLSIITCVFISIGSALRLRPTA